MELLCILCHWLQPLDDVVIRFRSDRIICLRCWLREVGGSRPLPVGMAADVTEALKGG